MGARAAALRKKQFFTEAIRAADDKITDTAIAQRAKTNAAQGKDERAIMENPQPVKLDDILASETGKVDVGGKPTSLTRASWNAIASEIKADPTKASEVIQKWGKQIVGSGEVQSNRTDAGSHAARDAPASVARRFDEHRHAWRCFGIG